jgi:ParB-like chromosome segregation protein Spo0J
MTNATKCGQHESARDSGPSSGARTGGSKYEVVAGARRLRAAKLAELENLPVRVVKLTDAGAIEAQCVELSALGGISSRIVWLGTDEEAVP